MRIVSDASPLIFLGKIGKLDLLEEHEVLIPQQVYEEILAGREKEDCLKIETLVKEKKIAVREAQLLKDVPFTLGKGENAAIALALQEKISIVLIDDKKGWTLAKLKKLRPKGTLAVLIEGYHNKQLSEVELRKSIEELMQQGFRLSQELLISLLNRIPQNEGKR